MRRQSLPGPERWNYRIGEWVRVRLGHEPKEPLRFRCGAVERTLPAGRQLEFIAPSPGGLLQILEGDTVLFDIGVNFFDETESNLRKQSTADAGRFADVSGLTAESGPASDPLFWVLLAIATAAIVGNWWVLGACREVEPLRPLMPGSPMNRIALLFPELLLLIVPLLFVYFWRGPIPGLGGLVRIVILAILALVAAALAPLGGRGVDVVIVADLSRSMPADSRTRELEVIRMLDQRASTGDRVGIVVYGREARIDRLPEEFGTSADFLREVDPDGSDLGGAISLAASLIPRERPGR